MPGKWKGPASGVGRSSGRKAINIQAETQTVNRPAMREREYGLEATGVGTESKSRVITEPTASIYGADKQGYQERKKSKFF